MLRLTPVRLEVVAEAPVVVPLRDLQSMDVGPFHVELGATAGGVRWAIANGDHRPLRLRAVRLIHRLDDAREPLRMFRHGWQSWSACGVATVGVDRDPSRAGELPSFVHGMFHADQRVVATGDELRSEWLVLLADADGRGAPLLVAFDDGRTHDGTFRVRRGDDGGIELVVEAFLGDAVLPAGARRPLHDVVVDDGARDAHAKLCAWARRAGDRAAARRSTPYQRRPRRAPRSGPWRPRATRNGTSAIQTSGPNDHGGKQAA